MQKFKSKCPNSKSVNYLVVDWGAGAQNPNYVTARNRVGEVGAAVASFINSLVSSGRTAFGRVFIVGHSLGGHVAGHTGKRTSGGRPQVIFATDPAGPLFSINAPAERLHSTDAVYTEAIHTNAGLLGFDQPITHASFYPNWGSTQPGCGVDASGACAHERSNLFYSESIRSNRFAARRCAAGYSAIVNRNCPTGGGTGTMGGNASKSLSGVFFLETNSASPFARG
jgi:pancreatic triacylglycerol lipase